MTQLSVTDDSQDLCNLFFNDSNQAVIIVNASTHKIIHVNDALLELIRQPENMLIGKTWDVLDKPNNKKLYSGYVKEMLSRESVSFSTEYENKGKKQTFNTNYHMGVLEGEIVYLGYLIADQANGISKETYKCLEKINAMHHISSDMEDTLSLINETLGFDFILYLEFQKNKISDSKAIGERNLSQKVLKNSKHLLIELMNKDKKLKLVKSNNITGDYDEILSLNQLESFCLYPIQYQNKIYGALIAGDKTKINNWDTISVLFNSLANQSRFGLFQKSIVEQNEIQGQVDKLTGLSNRKVMSQDFSELTKNGVDADKYLSLMIIDVDELNYLNKSIGIEFTNEVIVSISQVIIKGIRSKGKVYRLSGDEFVILYKPHTNKDLAESMAKDLMKNLTRPILLSNGEDVRVNFYLGISIFPDDGQTVSSMMKNADLAMNDAKLNGKNSYLVYKHSETGQILKQRNELVNNLKRAIKKNHFTAYFQPKINAETEELIGFEALVRWVDPEVGLINPGQFIPLAEETGLINEIGDFVTRFACQKLVEWQRKFGLSLSCSINLSAVQLKDLSLSKKIEKIINDSGVHPHFVDFEITETINLDNIPKLVTSLNQLVDIGCTLSIDDFGTGHSSLDYVKKIPAKYIKIDQSFVKNIGLNPEDEAILDATINIAKRLNRELIAEGVETEEQREYLLDRKCEYFQGYLFSKPLPADEIETLLQQRIKLMGSN